MSLAFNRKLWRGLQTTLLTIAGVASFLLLLELIRGAALLHRIHPWIAYLYLAALGCAVVFLIYRWVLARLDAALLEPPEMPMDGARSHDALSHANRFIAARLKRFAAHPALEPEHREHYRREAVLIDEMLGHHPLNDDLARSLHLTTESVLPELHLRLRVGALSTAREHMKRTVEDVLSHAASEGSLRWLDQVAMVTRIVESYIPRPSMLEYVRVIRDVIALVQRIDLLHQGPRLAEAVLSTAPPLGTVAAPLAHVIRSIWVTRVIAQAAIVRCEDIRLPDIDRLAGVIRTSEPDMIADVRAALMHEAVQPLKLMIRHAAPNGLNDPSAHTTTMMEGIQRALDAAVHSFRSRIAARTSPEAHNREPPESIESDEMRVSEGGHRKRRSRGKGFGRLFFVVGQRLKYTLGKRG